MRQKLNFCLTEQRKLSRSLTIERQGEKYFPVELEPEILGPLGLFLSVYPIPF